MGLAVLGASSFPYVGELQLKAEWLLIEQRGFLFRYGLEQVTSDVLSDSEMM